ncbi:hypothetical protein [Brasilonema sp. UFV-L1]|uniref:hypothetical protein n=1 Tax=Brasilonema sp. UFV-L1 TaxID=2234130 RepID=UPI00145D96BA|nr:hypothetical protein [Brasilonema sp. UFV-L1]NMG10086.1 hypothetical protein [Brasilonema sp. UFV-L1]
MGKKVISQLIFPLFLVILVISIILLPNNTQAHLLPNKIGQIHKEVSVNTLSSFNVANQDRMQAKLISSQTVKTKLTDNQFTPTQICFPLSTPLEINTARSQKDYLLEVQIAYQAQPRQSYSVYLNLPSLQEIAEIDTYYIGSLNFFDVPSPKQGIKKFNFDITSELTQQVQKRLQPSNIQNLTLTFICKQAYSSTDLVIESIALYGL